MSAKVEQTALVWRRDTGAAGEAPTGSSAPPSDVAVALVRSSGLHSNTASLLESSP